MNSLMNTQVYEQASQWLVEARAGELDGAARQRLDAWFRESPHHIRAFLELSSIWEEAGDPDLDAHHSREKLIEMARAAANVVALQARRGGPVEQANSRPPRASASDLQSVTVSPERAARRSRMSLPRLASHSLLAAAAAVIFMFAGWVALQRFTAPMYAADTGKQRIIRLQDGSQLTLNSRSRIRVRFSEHERAVDLLEGQALFQVARDPVRPFVVRSDGTRARAVGTRFDVYRKETGTTVTVVEGRVAVSSESRSSDNVQTARNMALGRVIMLAAGEQVTVSSVSEPEPMRADVPTATAWLRNQLIFESTPLTEVAAEFNRYNERQLVVSGPALADFRVTGIFSSADVSSLLRFLRAQRNIRIEETDRDIRISRP
jgi:transmembrane sensor